MSQLLNAPDPAERIQAIELMVKLETVQDRLDEAKDIITVQDRLDEAKDIITEQVEAVEEVIQTLIGGGKQIKNAHTIDQGESV